MANDFSSGAIELRQAVRASFGLLGSVFVFSAVVNLLMFTGPLFMLQVYERVLTSHSEETLLALLILVTLLYLFLAGLDFVRSRLLARFANRFRSTLESRVFHASFNSASQSGKLGSQSPALGHLDVLHSIFSSPVMSAIFDLPWTPLFFAAIFVFHSHLGWTALAGAAGLVVIALFNNFLTKRDTRIAYEFLGRANALSSASQSARGFVRSQNMLDNLCGRWSSHRDQFLGSITRAGDVTSGFVSFAKATRLFLQSLMLALGAWLTLKGELGAGAMIASAIILGRALIPVEQLVAQWADLQRAKFAWRGLCKFLGATPAPIKRVHLPLPRAELTLKSASVVDETTRKPLLNNVNLKVSPGQVVGVIGNSGAGKSTLAKVLLNIAPVNVGEVRLGGALLGQYDPTQLGTLIGYLPQSIIFFDGTISENIARMSEEIDHAQVFEAAKSANVHELILSTPNGYATRLKSIENHLSGGELQRIALARALYCKPIVLVLDEPTSALDNAGTEALNNAIRHFQNSERLVILMTHQPQAIAECDQLLVLENGRVSAFGPREDVLNAMVKNAQGIGVAMRAQRAN